MRIKTLLQTTLLLLLTFEPSYAQTIDWAKVDAAMGKTATVSDDVHRYGLPRSDLNVMLDGVTIKPSLALCGWVAFKPMQGGAMVMGDLVLLETEVNPVMSKLLEGGIEITAVHNHLLRATPPTFYMHIGGHGDPVTMATVIHAALAQTGTPFGTSAPPAPPSIDLDMAKLDQIMGAQGKESGGVYQFVVPRSNPAKEDGVSVTGPLGGANAINFQPTGSGKAAITGDFLVTGKKVNSLIRALRKNGIEVTAIHNHMLDDEPHMYFIHFWANDDALKLAKSVREALDQTDIQHK